ncbi:hypothetical protein P873_12110 [Arenimonas composti TR7-09 = DSM 18010]|uniref:Uncharacterized protein n=2 Tax=Arenimonas TaxID=490567 RepID=A0A091B950_9GAMM|nr:hypothetical protein P873_12110 [Arenimonas composti TR7-09 = DSM 18010]
MFLLLLALGLLGACGGGNNDAADQLFADMSENMRELAGILTGVTDEASARAAVPRIEAVREKMRDCARRARELPRPDAETEARQNAEMQALMEEVVPQIAAAQARIAQDPAILAILAPAMAGMENDL